MKIQLTDTPLELDALLHYLHTPRAGAVTTFTGTTRQWTDERETVELEYEAYAPMAEAEMRRLAEEATRRWPVQRVCIAHRVGVVPVAEASVFIGVATPHRDDAFAACRWLIDTLKEHVPIWKREVLRDGSKEWIEGDPRAPRG